MSQKIMIVGAGDFQLPLVKAASGRGEVILVAPAVSEEFFPYINKAFYLDVREKEEILRIAREEGISAIQTDQTDIPVRTVAYVAENMGLPGNDYETACLFSEKNLMRDKLRELGLPLLPYQVVSSYEEALRFLSSIESSIIVKPMGTQGSRGVAEVRTEAELSAAYDEAMSFSDDGRILVEKCAAGIEFVCESAVVNHHCQPLILGDTHYFSQKSLFSAKERIFPSQRSDEICRKVLDLNQKIVQGFGLKQGITHGEYILDEGEPYLLEIAARGGGVYISSDLIRLRTGLNTEEFLLDLALEGTAQIETEETGLFCGYRAFYLPTGQLLSAEGIEEVQALPYVESTQLGNIRPGMSIQENTNKTSRIAIIVTGRDHEEWREHVDYIREILHVSVEGTDGKKRDIIWD